VVLVDGERYAEDDLIAAVDAGAEDVATDGDLLKVTSEPSDLVAVREALEAEGVEVQSSELSMDPKTVVEISEEGTARRLVGLMETLDDHDDVDAVHANFDIPAELLEQAAA
jgi:transcriptional/translational regulatory protein YebC/TACO1